jgi:hypothetical protein
MLEVASGRRKTWAEHWKLHNALVLFNPAPCDLMQRGASCSRAVFFQCSASRLSRWCGQAPTQRPQTGAALRQDQGQARGAGGHR